MVMLLDKSLNFVEFINETVDFICCLFNVNENEVEGKFEKV